MNFSAIYYDGVSSKPHHIFVTINNHTLSFKINNEECNWDLSLCELSFNENYIEIKTVNSDTLLNFTQDIEELSNLLKPYQSNTFYNKLINLNLSLLTGILVGFLVLLFFANKYIVPPIAEKATILIPQEFDKSIGDASFETFLLTAEIDSIKSKQLTTFVNALEVNQPELKFYVFDSPTVNAFCLPNGTIVVYSGILNIIDNKEELIGLLAHEMAHYNRRHSIKSITRDLASLLIISLVTNDAAGITGVIAEHSNRLYSLSYSRTFESEADDDALTFMKQKRINPKGLETLFKKLATHNTVEIPEFISTHPDANKRAEKIANSIAIENSAYKEYSYLEELFQEIKKEH